ncbi:DUF4350 domain-containing protein [uncultured Flavobacterium sp.]|uniref:DUF4350 domain-containing protein n=1 Tax=uncultured Flavobacterium sp. TaxID=165435 RepID=UPI0030EE84C8|tara:strand:+ start:41491 stop:42696 length:1206 start_codon:yes stop_codon:yes gene_type:complete
MNRNLKVYVFLLVLILIGIILVDASRPKPINWTPTFALNDKIPFGLYIFGQESEKLFSNQKVTKHSNTPYEYFYDKYDYEDSTYTVKGDILFINDEFTIDKNSVDELFYYASRGNDVFISSSSFSKNLKDTLGFEIETSSIFMDSFALKVYNKNLNPKDYYYSKGVSTKYFSKIDTTTTVVLGHQSSTKENLTNFIKIPYKSGNFYLHTQPIVFTNYYMLKNKNHEYVEQITSYLNQDKIYWFVKSYNSGQLNQSPMRYILSQASLRWAWYISLISILIFIVFNAKRKQRVIPIIEPLRNTTVDFTKTIGNLYYQEGNHKNIIDKKIIYFLEKTRNEYLIETTELDATFINRFQQKSGNKKEEIAELVQLINQLKRKETCNESDIVTLNLAIEKLNQKKDK